MLKQLIFISYLSCHLFLSPTMSNLDIKVKSNHKKENCDNLPVWAQAIRSLLALTMVMAYF